MTFVCTFYRFVHLADPALLQRELYETCRSLALKGTILLAHEGVNGTLAGSRAGLAALQAHFAADARLAKMACRYSEAGAGNPVFHRLKVKVKPEIVALGQPGVNPADRTGQHVDAESWNRLLDDRAVRVVDTRNRYEIGIGTFPRALDPGTRSFREFPQFVAETLAPHRDRPIALFCTGGIRCEKASAWLLQQGFPDVYQLDGGVLRYLETAAESRWLGECFVFDQRVSVTPGLAQGSYQSCHACRHPLSDADRASPLYAEDLWCPHCFHQLTPAQRLSFAERKRQAQLAADRGELHVGAVMPPPRAGQPPLANAVRSGS
jgi:UPF0176 protein